ncbi:MAG TPA: hypothetical protein VM734_13790, partial [Kofleriaceae bacterium]|nr:hypothetical protein [Kofleriaceae bacterium]
MDADAAGDAGDLRARATDAARLLETLIAAPHLLAELDDDTRRRLSIAAGQLSRPDRYVRKQARKGLVRREARETKAADAALLDG